MRLAWIRASRIPRPPRWAVAVGGFWLLLVLAGVLAERWGAPGMETCLLRHATGHPCPTCGSTRVVQELARGDWADAFRLNPLVAMGLLIGGLGLLARAATGLKPALNLSPRERGALLAAGLLVLAANWAWVLKGQS